MKYVGIAIVLVSATVVLLGVGLRKPGSRAARRDRPSVPSPVGKASVRASSSPRDSGLVRDVEKKDADRDPPVPTPATPLSPDQTEAAVLNRLANVRREERFQILDEIRTSSWNGATGFLKGLAARYENNDDEFFAAVLATLALRDRDDCALTTWLAYVLERPLAEALRLPALRAFPRRKSTNESRTFLMGLLLRREESPAVRIAAIHGLETMHPEALRQALQALTTNELDPQVRKVLMHELKTDLGEIPLANEGCCAPTGGDE